MPITREEKKDPRADFRNKKKKADGGDMAAQESIAFEYAIGGLNHPIDRDHEKAIEYYRKAIAQGSILAKNGLAFNCLQNGSREEQAEAVSLYRAAADPKNIRANCPAAQANLGNCLYRGIGPKKDSSEAILWLCRAVNNGRNKAAIEWLSERSFNGRYNVEFRESDKHNTPLTKEEIIEVVRGINSAGRARTNASTIIGNLVNFSVSEGKIKTEAELDEILEVLKKNNPALIPEKSKSCLMINTCAETLRARTTSTSAAATRIPEAAEASGAGTIPSASPSFTTTIKSGREAVRS